MGLALLPLKLLFLSLRSKPLKFFSCGYSFEAPVAAPLAARVGRAALLSCRCAPNRLKNWEVLGRSLCSHGCQCARL